MFEDDLINTIEVNIIVLWLNLFFKKSIKKIINRDAKNSNIFHYDKRKSKKVSPLATTLIEHLTEESNGHMTAAAINTKIKPYFRYKCQFVDSSTS